MVIMDFRDIKEFSIDAFKYFVMIVIIFLIVMYVVSVQQVVGPSMEPNYQSGDVMLLDKIKYRFFPIERFDVVTLVHEEKYLIKRVIGLPGETIRYENNQLYIDGEVVEESFLGDVTTDDFDLSMIDEVVIGEDEYFVVGDNRTNSQDSRHFGLVSKKDIVGKVEFRIWPFRTS